MARGGAREGAGRKRKLSYMQGMAAAAEIDRRWRVACDWRKKQARDATHKKIEKVWQQARDDRDNGYSLSMYHLDNVEDALVLDQNLLPGSLPSRFVSIRWKYPKGALKKIIERVARERDISYSTAKKYLDRHRRLERETD